MYEIVIEFNSTVNQHESHVPTKFDNTKNKMTWFHSIPYKSFKFQSSKTPFCSFLQGGAPSLVHLARLVDSDVLFGGRVRLLHFGDGFGVGRLKLLLGISGVLCGSLEGKTRMRTRVV